MTIVSRTFNAGISSDPGYDLGSVDLGIRVDSNGAITQLGSGVFDGNQPPSLTVATISNRSVTDVLCLHLSVGLGMDDYDAIHDTGWVNDNGGALGATIISNSVVTVGPWFGDPDPDWGDSSVGTGGWNGGEVNNSAVTVSNIVYTTGDAPPPIVTNLDTIFMFAGF